jgi:hypothetical protein
MITVYGARLCEDTRRSLRHLRRLGVLHRYKNVDEDLEALARASSLNGGVRRTPTIDLGVGGAPLIEPTNDTLTGALVELEMLTQEQADERLRVQNVGDMERIGRALAGLAVLAAGRAAPSVLRWPLRIIATALVLSGISGWCPAYAYAGRTSLGGPGDRPDEATRDAWLAPAASRFPEPSAAGQAQR